MFTITTAASNGEGHLPDKWLKRHGKTWKEHFQWAFLVVVIAGWIAMASVLVLRLDGRSIDDIFITYRYSQNLVLGNGFVFNPGERVFATTAPGYGLLLAFLHVVTRTPIEVLGTASTGAALVLLASLLLFDCRQNSRTLEGMLGGTWLVGCCYLWLFHGSEIFVALTLLACSALLARRYRVIAGLSAGLAVWFRPESLLAVVILAALLWIENKRVPLRFTLSSAAVAGAGTFIAWLWFGHPLPKTLAAKRAQADSGFGVWQSGSDFWNSATQHFSATYGGWITVPLIVCGLVGLILAFRLNSMVLRLLILYSLALLMSYPLLAVAYYPWYGIPVVVVILYGVVFSSVGIARVVSLRLRSEALRSVSILFVTTALLVPVAATLIPRSIGLFEHFKIYSLRYHLYRKAGLWLNRNTPPGAEIGCIEVGTIAFWSQRPIHDYLALTTPDSLDFVYDGDILSAVLKHPAEYLIRHSRVRLMEAAYTTPWFKENYIKVRRISLTADGEYLRIYRRIDIVPSDTRAD